MAVKVDLILTAVNPGDTVYFEFEVTGPNPEQTASSIKQQVWAHPLLDYQSGKLTPGLFNTETNREVAILRVVASVRKTRKNSDDVVKNVPLTDVDAYMAALPIVWGEQVQGFWTFVENYPSLADMGNALKGGGQDVTKLLPWLLLAGLAYVLVKG